MAHPLAPKPGDPVKQVGQIFGTPLIINGWTWLPVNQLLAWGIFTWLSVRSQPARPPLQQIGLGGLKMFVFLGSEWCHNLAHAAAARWVGKPMDALLVVAGMPMVIYDHPDDPTVTPRQHLLRSAAGPAVNILLLALARLFHALTRPGSGLREVADTAVGMNTLLSSASFNPNPAFDGGPLLKWSLVSRGSSETQADAAVKTANRVTGAGLGGAAGVALSRRVWLPGIIMAFLAAACLVYGFGSSPHRPDVNRSA